MIALISRTIFLVLLGLVNCVFSVNPWNVSSFTRSEESSWYAPTWESLDSRPTPSWYDEAKFGVFMHWGVYSVPAYGTEWMWKYWKDQDDPRNNEMKTFMKKNYRPGFKYADFATMFTARHFNADKWAKIIAKSNAKYFVFTSKHHDGYTNWPSKESWNWNSVDIGPKKDIVGIAFGGGALADAIRSKTDMKFCLYYSLYEWFNPLYLEDKKKKFKSKEFVKAKTIPQLYDIVTKYRPEYIWSDGDWETNSTYWLSREFLAWLYNSSPVKDTVVVNDRWGIDANCKHGDVKLCKDRYSPKKLLPFKWENAMTIDAKSWGFRANAPLSDYLSIIDLIETLAETVSYGGNLLMNIAPTMDGVIPPIYQERLEQIGDWLETNGEGIFGTKPWKHQTDPRTRNLWYTSKGKSVYAIISEWPRTSKLQLIYPRPTKETRVTMLGLSDRLKWSTLTEDRGISIDLSDISIADLPSTLAWTFQMKNLGNN